MLFRLLRLFRSADAEAASVPLKESHEISINFDSSREADISSVSQSVLEKNPSLELIRCGVYAPQTVLRKAPTQTTPRISVRIVRVIPGGFYFKDALSSPHESTQSLQFRELIFKQTQQK